MEIQYRKLGELTPYEKNPRKNDEAVQYVMESIKTFGFKVPLVVDKNNVIVAGHTRFKASQKLSLAEVPVIVADDLTDEQIKAFRLADNKVAEKSDWDFDLLGDELSDILDVDMTALGFDEESEPEDAFDVGEDDFDVEATVADAGEPLSRPGEVWQLGRHRLMCGDSTDPAAVEKLMGGVKADMVFTDPPYNVDYQGKTVDRLKIKNDSMSDGAFYSFLLAAFTSMAGAVKEGGGRISAILL